MTDETRDSPELRAACRYQLRANVRHQDGRNSLAPALIFADADYEVGDGISGLHVDAKSANEPAIIYTRADALMDAIDSAEFWEGCAVKSEKRWEAAEKANKALRIVRDELRGDRNTLTARIAELEAERDRLRSALRGTVRQISKAMSPDIAVRLKDWREAMDEARAALRATRTQGEE